MSVWDELNDMEVNMGVLKENVSKHEDNIRDMLSDIDRVIDGLKSPDVDLEYEINSLEEVYSKLNDLQIELY